MSRSSDAPTTAVAGAGRLDVSNPFPGIRPFRYDEADLFFGRDDRVHELLQRIRRSRFVAVLGNSGTGKSSLVRAGLLPPLEAGFMAPSAGSWTIATMRPGERAVEALAVGLAEALPEADAARVERTLRTGALGLVQTVRPHVSAGGRFLIVADQFEELFRFMEDPSDFEGSDEARAFVNLLLEGASQDEVPIYVVLTLRAEFLGYCSPFPGLPEAINRGLYLVPAMSRDEYRAAIEGPMEHQGADISGRLVNQLLDDVSRQKDPLPVLGHALNGMWKIWRQRCEATAAPDVAGASDDEPPMDLEDYEEIGGLEGALDRHLESVFAVLDERGKEAAERVFRRITTITTDGAEVRRPTRLSALCSGSQVDEQSVRNVIEAFRAPGRSFLMPPPPEPLADNRMIDLSHEAILRRWNRLKVWMQEEAADGRLLRDLERDAGEWDANGRHRSYLYSGARLTAARQWERERAGKLSVLEGAGLKARPLAHQFLRSSIRFAQLVRSAVRLTVVAVVIAAGWWGYGRYQTSIDRERLLAQDPERAMEAATRLVRSGFDAADLGEMEGFEPSPAMFVGLRRALDDLASRDVNLAARTGGLWEAIRERFTPPPTEAQDTLLNRRVRLEGGPFSMGSQDGDSDERPVRRVTVSPFRMQEHEVTNREYQRFDPGRQFEPADSLHPVANVSWYEAAAYADWLGGGLPTEAQWEFAARGVAGRAYPWGDDPPTCERAQFGECEGGTVEVRSLSLGASPDSIFDLAGNVWEWVGDWYGPYDPADTLDPRGPETGSWRVVRGGSFVGLEAGLRGSFRINLHPVSESGGRGFRVVWSSAGGQD